MNEEEMRMYNLVNEIVQDVNVDELEEELDNLAVELYNHESNFNNADKESGQRVETLEEIKEQIQKALKKVKENSDNCSNCGKMLQDEDFITENNRVPYGDSYADERIVVGVVCSKCGEEEVY